ncbi:MAG TPA: adenylate/guanylate cyclase domain-containing protein [Stellaceae bacterium]|nr:adenylate/guanylate cyclase domain-containing protein [Stellaceae bacterium]
MAEERVRRRLAAILSADVVGYSRLMGADEAGTLGRLKALRRDVIDPMIAAHSGRTVKLIGDGTLVEFASAVDAVSCAIEVQKRVREGEAARSNDSRIELRIGINVGDVIVDGDDIYGDGVNVAARIEALAEPGGIYVSRSAADQVRDKLPFKLEPRGEQTVKNIARPIEVFQVVAEASQPLTEARAGPALPVSDKISIAVLAFTNMSGDPEQEYFSDGISEDIITDLSKLQTLQVIARNSSFTYKGKSVDVKQVGRELGVQYVLEGSIRKAGNRVRVNAQLIEAANGGHLWAERYDRNLTDIFEVQDDLTQQIVGALKITLTDSAKSAISAGGTKSVAAHDLFLRGRERLFGPRKDREIFEQCMADFRRAIEIDPAYGAPYAGLAMGHLFDYQNRWTSASDTALAEGDRLAREAIAKDEKDPFAHFVAAAAALFLNDYDRAIAEGDVALSLSPNYALALSGRGMALVYGGEPLKAIPLIERAMRLDPAQTQNMHNLGIAYFFARDYATAAACFRNRIELVPTTDLSRAYLISALGHLGEATEARRVWRELEEINPHYSFEDHIGRLPFRNPADVEMFMLGLRKAELRT